MLSVSPRLGLRVLIQERRKFAPMTFEKERVDHWLRGPFLTITYGTKENLKVDINKNERLHFEERLFDPKMFHLLYSVLRRLTDQDLSFSLTALLSAE
jgi:hypothetical protein